MAPHRGVVYIGWSHPDVVLHIQCTVLHNSHQHFLNTHLNFFWRRTSWARPGRIRLTPALLRLLVCEVSVPLRSYSRMMRVSTGAGAAAAPQTLAGGSVMPGMLTGGADSPAMVPSLTPSASGARGVMTRPSSNGGGVARGGSSSYGTCEGSQRGKHTSLTSFKHGSIMD